MFCLCIYSLHCALHGTPQRLFQGLLCFKNVLMFLQNTFLFNFLKPPPPSKCAPFPALIFTILTNVQKNYFKVSNTNQQRKEMKLCLLSHISPYVRFGYHEIYKMALSFVAICYTEFYPNWTKLYKIRTEFVYALNE